MPFTRSAPKPSPTQLVRLPRAEHRLLKALAKTTGLSQQEVLARALREYRRTQFLHTVNRAYARLRSDPSEWQKYQHEIAVWDGTLSDGLQ